MLEAYVGDIRIIATGIVPSGWLACNGQVLGLNDYVPLYLTIGTSFGGDGQQTFGLPDLRGRTPIHMGQGNGLSPRSIGVMTGSETVTLTPAQLPSHYHSVVASNVAGTTADPTGSAWAGASTAELQYSDKPANASMSALGIAPAGGGQPHDNLMPFQVVSFIICFEGIMPSPGEQTEAKHV
ncbi:MAG: tail fiber protein [Betaproteobacteria bacterium]